MSIIVPRFMRKLYFVMFLALCATLVSCGNKGPLVQPDKHPTQQDSDKK